MLIRRIFSVLVTLSFLFSFSISCHAEIEEGVYYVQNVIDGDTIELGNGRRVRYIGINTPETMRREGRKWVYAPEAYGEEAKNLNRELVFRKKVRLEFDKEKEDRYGRLLAYVYADNGLFVNKKLIDEGYATLYTFLPNARYYADLLAAQKEAISKRKGIWGSLKTVPADAAASHIGEFVAVSGKVGSTANLKGKISLYVAGSGGKKVKGLIFNKNVSLFKKAGIDPAKFYKGKEVEMVGKLGYYRNACEMILDNPSQIKVIPEQ